MKENKNYKHADYLIRSRDYYAMTKYHIITKWLPEKSDLRVLNIGCGSGEMNLLLANNSTWIIDAIDIDSEAVQLSQSLKEQYEIQNITVFHISIEKYDPQIQYDIIISNDVLEHIENDEEAIQKLWQLLKPEGTLYLSVPALQTLFAYHDEMLGHYRRYNRRGLKKKLSHLFSIEKCRYFAFSLIPITLLYSCWLRKAYPIDNSDKQSMITILLKTILKVEANLFSPIGISLLAHVEKKSADQ